MVALYYSRIKYSIVENGKQVRTARYDFMRALIDRIGVADVAYVTPEAYDVDKDSFSFYHVLGEDGLLQRVDAVCQPELLIDRSFFGPKHPQSSITVISNPKLRSVSLDKFAMYDWLSDVMPYSVKLEPGNYLWEELGPKVVVKARRGSGGKKIWIVSPPELRELQEQNPQESYLVQKLVESDGQKAGLGFTGRHDVRLFIVGDNVVGSYIRRPQAGKYVANVNHGGTLSVVSVDSLPSTLIEFAQKVINILPGGLQIFSIDCFYDVNEGWKVIEINANAGLPGIDYGEHALSTLNAIADYVVGAYNEMRKS